MKLPIYNKAFEILKTVKLIGDIIPDDNENLQTIKGFMLEDALLLCPKIAGAESVDLYDIKMENATLIRKAAKDLMVQNHGLELYGFEHVEYFQIVRDLLEEFRLLFIDWVDSFNPEDYTIDRWGLFNPPGVGPSDKDPDEDIPFDSDDFDL